jgi:hypothetical protein
MEAMAMELQWHERRNGGLYADTGLGRYTVSQSDRVVLRHNGVVLGVFDSLDEAKARAQRGADYAHTIKAEDEALDGSLPVDRKLATEAPSK